MLEFGGTKVGEGQPVYMIAEVGINHNADMTIVKRLIDATFACGWNCVKFQKRNPDLCVPEGQKNVVKQTPWGEMTYLEYKRKMELWTSEYDYINEYCGEKDISWTASVWDMDSVDFINTYDVPFFKIPSAHMTNDDLLTWVAQTRKPVIMSTGMSIEEEIDHAVDHLDKYGVGFALMHTNSSYPTPPIELNLNMITTLKERYGCVVGYSGHEYGLDPSVMAVTLGADIIERHITLDHTMWGTDQAASLEIHAMDMLGKRIREARISLGDGIKRVTESEIPIRKKLRG